MIYNYILIKRLQIYRNIVYYVGQIWWWVLHFYQKTFSYDISYMFVIVQLPVVHRPWHSVQ